ncbi:unannotated protein [freshwater metagenome]|uniref:Unannotated protein n=1 Tax=freshwater metagenome TaxID=449393 RepID=A0A6J6WCU1_9ZZZZ
MQSCPALKNPAIAIPSAADSRLASSKTTTGALPPSSRCTLFNCFAAEPATSIPARTDPVIETIAGVACSTNARPVSRSPQSTLNTPLGKNSDMTCAMKTVDAGVVSLGFSTTVFPAAIAGAHFQTAIIIG